MHTDIYVVHHSSLQLRSRLGAYMSLCSLWMCDVCRLLKCDTENKLNLFMVKQFI